MRINDSVMIVFLAFLISLLFGGCRPGETNQPSIDDPCAPEHIAETIKPFDSTMRAFEDTTAIAYNMPRPQVSEQIAVLQGYRREVLDEQAPPCLVGLKEAEVAYMDSVINTLLVFLEGAPGEITTEGVQSSEQLKSIYVEALENLMDITVTPQPTQMRWTPQAFVVPTEAIPVTGVTETSVTDAGPNITPTLFSTLAGVINPGGANVRLGPSMDDEFPVVVPEGEQVEIVGRTEDGEWFLVLESEMPDEIGWVYASLVELEIPVEQIPVVMEVQTVTPTP
jgi:hypothetical protein